MLNKKTYLQTDYYYADILDHVVNKFKMKWGVPQGFSAVNGGHVLISASRHLHTE